MPRTVEITPDEVVVRLSGWTAVAALKRTLRIPRPAIRGVSTDPWRGDGWRIAGTAMPFRDYRQGWFRRDGKWQFLSFERRDRVVAITLDRRLGSGRLDVAVLGVDDPEAVAAELA